jgi:Xaa-Pro dipeptidase
MELLPGSEAEHRVGKLQGWMQDASIDAVLILQNTDLYYFSGTAQNGILCIPCTGDPVYLVSKSITRAREESVWKSILPLMKPEDAAHMLESEGISELKNIGLEMDVIPAALYFRICRAFPRSKFIDASEVIRSIRMIKSAYEVGQIRIAANMLMGAWERLPAWICEGATELEVLAQVEQYLRLHGHQGIQRTRGFNYEVGYGAFSAGPDACFPTSFAGATGFKGLYPAVSNTGSGRRLAVNEPLMVDVCGGYGGYLADATRTFAIGRLPADMREAHSWILELNAQMESMLKPGAECREICDYAFSRAQEIPRGASFMGAGDNFTRFIGHAVGLELDELPVLSSKSSALLEPGMTLAIEPKIFFPDRGGVGIENMYLIKESGFEKLTPFREDIIYC